MPQRCQKPLIPQFCQSSSLPQRLLSLRLYLRWWLPQAVRQPERRPSAALALAPQAP